MPLQLELMNEHDIKDWILVANEAFADGIARLVYNSPATPESLAHDCERYQKILKDPTARLVKVFDTATGAIVAGARWHFYATERPEEVVNAATAHSDIPDRANPRAFTDFSAHLDESRRVHMGTKPHALLAVIATHPDHQRRGAGRLLMDYGIQETDQMNLMAYLEASTEGKPLYERYGFEQVERVDFNLADYHDGVEGIQTSHIMIRPAKLAA